MHITKRLLSLLLLAAMLLGLLVGCGKDDVTKGGNADRLPDETAAPIVLEPLDDDQKLNSVVTRAPGGSTTLEYTLMVYMVGSDLESNYGSATDDLIEMINSGVDTSRINVLVYTGGARYWNNNIVTSDCNAIYRVCPNNIELVASSKAPSNTGDPETFLDFMDYAYKNYPAKHYAMICWDHGTGPLIGFGSDELFGGDSLQLPELEAAFKKSPFASKKLDFLGFDACLMATMETAEMADGYANFLIASEELEPGTGWDYGFLATLNSTSDTKNIGQKILSTYEASMAAYEKEPEYTLSMLDLSKMNSFISSADKLFSKMASGVKNGKYSSVAKAREKTLYFNRKSKTVLDVVDIGDAANQVKSLYSSEAGTLQSQLSKLVIGQVSNVKGSSGLAVYYPYHNKSLYQNGGGSLAAQMTGCAGYKSFLSAFTDYWINGEPATSYTEHQVTQPAVTAPPATQPPATQPPATQPPATQPPATQPPATQPVATNPPATQPTISQDGNYASHGVQLTQAQLDNLSSVTFTLFYTDTDKSSGQTVYIPVLKNVPVEPDSSGVVRVPANQKLIVMRTDAEEEGVLWPAMRVPGTGAAEYFTVSNYLTPTVDTIDGTEEISIWFTEGNTNRMNILSVNSVGSGETASRAQPDLSHWEFIAKRYETFFQTCDNSGVLTAYTSWDSSGDEYYNLLPYEEEFWLEQISVSSLDEEIYYQIVLTDTQGNSFGSAVYKYSNGATYSQQLINGVMYYVYSDHAKVVSYEGTGGALTIAATAGGKPVTEIATEAFYYNGDITQVYLPDSVQIIGERAFANCRNLTSVYMPASLKTIRAEAFANSGLKHADLPKSLERIEFMAFAGTAVQSVNLPVSIKFLGNGVFADCQDNIGFLIDFDANGKNAYFKVVNGLLLTSDGKELVQAPLGSSTTLTVPAGVEVIRNSAVRGSERITSVVFPEGLREIGCYAFYDTVNLQELKLPESLEYIGNSAFGKFGVTINTASPVKSVFIGSKVHHIGYDAFDAFPISSFVVGALNPNYSAVNDCLLNKNGTVFYHAPYTHTGVLTIPSGVNHLDFHCLNLCDGITELVLPDSVVSMDKYIGLPDNLNKLTVGSNLIRWDNIMDTCSIAQVEISNANRSFVMKDDSIYSKDMTVLYVYRGTGSSLTVPEGVKEISDTAFAPGACSSELKKLSLPSTVQFLFGEIFKELTSLEAVEISENNANYASSDGMIYTKNGVSLILCPQGKTGNVSVKVGTTTIWRYAFWGKLQADKIVIPEGVENIRQGNFTAYRSDVLSVQLPGTLKKIYPDLFRSAQCYSVICPAGSTADAFARSRGMEVKN